MPKEKAVQFKKPEKWYRDFKEQTAKVGSTPSATARTLSEKWLSKKLESKQP